MNKGQLFLLIAVLLLTLCLGLYYVQPNLYSREFGHDEGNYIAMAQRLADTGVYSYTSDEPDAFVPPVFPLYLTLCCKIFGFEPQGLAAMRIMQVFFTVLTVFLVYIYGRQLSGKPLVGIFAAGFIAVNLDYYSYTKSFLTENLYFLILMLFAVVFTHAVQQGKPWEHFVSGIIFCVCVLLRSTVFAVVTVLYMPILKKHRDNKKYALKCIALFALGFVLVASPWWIRNAVVFGEFIPFCKQKHVIFAGLARYVESLYALGIKEPDTMLGGFAAMLELFKIRPLRTAYWFTVGKFSVLFMERGTGAFSTLTAITKSAVLYLGIPICLRELFLKRRRWQSVCFLVYLAVAFLGVVDPRYGLQYLFFLSVCAGRMLDLLIMEK